jgi:hypothetical protein
MLNLGAARVRAGLLTFMALPVTNATAKGGSVSADEEENDDDDDDRAVVVGMDDSAWTS